MARSPRGELVELALARIERLDGELKAFGAVLAMSSTGLPMVVQLIARADDEATLLSRGVARARATMGRAPSAVS